MAKTTGRTRPANDPSATERTAPHSPVGRGTGGSGRGAQRRGSTGAGSERGFDIDQIQDGSEPEGGDASGAGIEAREVWGKVWRDFSINRERDRTNAYLTLLRDISDQGNLFVPDLISPKDYADMIIHVESFIKQDTGAKEGSAIERVREFLSTGIFDEPTGTVN